MIIMDNINLFDKNVNKKYKGLREDMPAGSIEILSPDIIDIRIHNMGIKKSMDYTENGITYNVTFSSYTELDDDGMVGTYVDPPEDNNFRDIKLIVTGFHRKWDTEVTLSHEYISVMPDRELKHLINFQRAILKTGKL